MTIINTILLEIAEQNKETVIVDLDPRDDRRERLSRLGGHEEDSIPRIACRPAMFMEKPDKSSFDGLPILARFYLFIYRYPTSCLDRFLPGRTQDEVNETQRQRLRQRAGDKE